MKFVSALLLVLITAVAGCRSGSPEPATEPAGPPPPTSPTAGQVLLDAEAGWQATLLLDNKNVGVWTVKVFPFFPIYGSPEVIGLDDYGRVFVMVSYSGKWYPMSVLRDGWWLGGLTHGEVDPRIDGPELYTGGKLGILYQIVPTEDGLPDGRRVAKIPGREIHTMLAGDLDPTSDGPELIIFTRPGALYRATPVEGKLEFDVTLLEEYEGRVRDAVVLPDGKRIATVSRTGQMRLLTLTTSGPKWETIYEVPMGLGRIAMDATRPNLVLYTTHDDGRISRHEERGGAWRHEIIYLGPQGPRGVTVGTFDEDDATETIAIFGYSGRVELLTGKNGKWAAETLFVDSTEGHWIATGELDGRNSTDELVCSGFGGRIVMLFRSPGYGLRELHTPVDQAPD
jgi:hypothetical protein